MDFRLHNNVDLILVSLCLLGVLPHAYLYQFDALLFPKLSSTTFNAANKPAQMPGDCDQ